MTVASRMIRSSSLIKRYSSSCFSYIMDSSSSPFSTWLDDMELDKDELPRITIAGSTGSGNNRHVDKWIDNMALVSVQDESGD